MLTLRFQHHFVVCESYLQFKFAYYHNSFSLEGMGSDGNEGW